jgi:hypothetical protein
MLGSKGTITYLRDSGVDVFDDYIDHDYYDNEPDAVTRLNKVHKLIDSLIEQDLNTVYQKTSDRRLANKNKFKNGDFGTNYRNQLTTCINMLN